MSTISTAITCSNEECGADIDIDGEVIIGIQRHPYGSTTAVEDISEVDGIEPTCCPECRHDIDEDAAAEALMETARELLAERY